MAGIPTRRDRIIVLLQSFDDAFHPERGDGNGRGGKPGSKVLVHGPLWNAGSYQAVSDQLDVMRCHAPKLYRSVEVVYMGRSREYAKSARRSRADAGVEFLFRRLPRDVFVPADLLENAGFTVPSRKRKAERPLAA